MENTVKERLKYYLKKQKIKAVDFCKAIGVSSGFISGMRESIQPDKLKSIAINYPSLDIGWLMTGEGKMLKASTDNSSISNHYEGDFVGGQFSTQIGDNNTIGSHNAIGSSIAENRDKEIIKLKKENEVLKQEKEALKQENTILKTQVEEKDRFIKMLLDK